MSDVKRRYFDEKGMWYLVKNEDRKSIRELAKIFNCTTKELYEFYNEVTNTEEYKKFILNRSEIVKHGRWLKQMEAKRNGRIKEILNIRQAERDKKFNTD